MFPSAREDSTPRHHQIFRPLHLIVRQSTLQYLIVPKGILLWYLEVRYRTVPYLTKYLFDLTGRRKWASGEKAAVGVSGRCERSCLCVSNQAAQSYDTGVQYLVRTGTNNVINPR